MNKKCIKHDIKLDVTHLIGINNLILGIIWCAVMARSSLAITSINSMKIVSTRIWANSFQRKIGPPRKCHRQMVGRTVFKLWVPIL